MMNKNMEKISYRKTVMVAVEIIRKAELHYLHSHEQMVDAVVDNIEYIHDSMGFVIPSEDIQKIAYIIKEVLKA